MGEQVPNCLLERTANTKKTSEKRLSGVRKGSLMTTPPKSQKQRIRTEDAANSENQVYTRLKDMAVHNHFLPGQQLHPAELAHSLGVSATPVREMLHRLYAEALVVCVPKRGFFARTPSYEEFADLFDFSLAILEWSLSRFPGGDGTVQASSPASNRPRDSDCLKDAVAKLEWAIEQLVAATCNEFALRAIRNINERLRTVRLILYEPEADARRADDVAAQLRAHIAGRRLDSVRYLVREILQDESAGLYRAVAEALSRPYTSTSATVRTQAALRNRLS